jgi:protein-tyrosine-phosphatase
VELTTEQQLLMKQVAARIHDEFAGTLSAETIERFITDSREILESRARFATWLPILLERFTRDRLRALARVEGRSAADKPAIVFLCVHNAGRSQMAAGWARQLASDRIELFSGGSDPAGEVNPAAVAAMAEAGVDISGELPQPWTDEIVRAADVVVTMGCGDACPVFPAIRYEDWELTDPAGLPIEEVRPVRDEIRDRVADLLTRLGVEIIE